MSLIPEFGHFALILALCLAVVQIFFPLVGAARGMPNWIAVARPAALAQGLFVSFAFGCLAYSFMINDFSVLYVTQHSNSALPDIYRFAAVWGGHEGSLLLWVLMLTLWSAAVAVFSRNLSPVMAARVLAVMGFISCGFLLFMLATSNPFDRIFPVLPDGRDLNPLLQDPGLVFHPPLLYMGYVGFSVAFGFALAALIGGNPDSAWARWSRPWTNMAWAFLTGGIVLGSWWAYYELGWGGWWFWDPVENASFMPWLVGTALIHSLAVTEKRGVFKNWTILLAISAFSLSLLGTFLVRSGVLTSVHAFATDPERGVFILIFLAVVIGVSLALFAWRAPRSGKGGYFKAFSRETLLLANNVLLVVAAGSVLLGTLYPLFLDALGGDKISVGPPYFGNVFFYVMAPLVVILGVGPLTRWKSDDPKHMLNKLKITAVLSVVCAIAFALLFKGGAGWVVIPALAGAAWIFFTTLQNVREKTRHKSLLAGLVSLPAGFYGMTVAHIGMAVFIVGATLVNTFSIEKDVRVVPGEPLQIGAYRFLLKNIEQIQGPNYRADRGTIEVVGSNGEKILLHPEKRIYRVQTMPMTEAAIDPGFSRDIYVALGEPLGDNAWSMRVYYKPFMRWVWMGGVFMALGGLLAVFDKRYRRMGAKEAMASVKTGGVPA